MCLNKMMFRDKNNFIKGSTKLCVSLLLVIVSSFGYANTKNEFIDMVKNIEVELGARMGVEIFDTETTEHLEYNQHDLFPLLSTFKPIACAMLLNRVDRGLENLNRIVVIKDEDLVNYSPVTKNRVGKSGMSLAELCEAAITVSDNTAGNYILKAIGGLKR